jgi:diguanylate cyclase (GGDEF)-like protein
MNFCTSAIPKAFDSNIYKILEDFDELLLFHWDLTTDTVEFSTEMKVVPYALPSVFNCFSSFLLLSGFIHPSDAMLFEKYLDDIFYSQSCPPQKRFDVELRLLRADRADYMWTEVKLVTYFSDKFPQATFGLFRNIHAQKEHNLTLLHEAEHDTLTGLLNKGAAKQHITEYLSSLPAATESSALLIIDADDFKKINDSFGHLFGDAVLTDMAMELEHYFRRMDIIGRVGGDEFLVLFRGIPSIDYLQERCQQLLESLHRSYKNDTNTLSFSISIGIALFPRHGKNFTELFTHADRALYNAKCHGKGTFSVYEPNFLNTNSISSERDPLYSADMQQKAFKDNMIEFIFRLLYETKNPEATITISLRMLGKLFNFDRIAIDLYNRLDNSYRNTFEWLSPLGVSLHTDISQKDPAFADAIETCNHVILSRYKATPWGIMSICEDTSQLIPPEASAFKHFNIHSFAYNEIARGSEELGCICFESAADVRKFTKEELTYLNIFSSILGNVLLHEQTDSLLSKQNKRLMDIIDHMQEMIYVVDKDTFELLFFNQTIRQALPETTVQQTCYHRFHKFSEPCPNCPVRNLSDNGAEYIVRTVSSWGVPAKARAFNIDWLPNRKTSLIIMEP